MNATLSIELDPYSAATCLWDCALKLEQIKAAAEAQMAGRYQEIVQANFGANGLDRPKPWPLLSPSYAREVGRIYATLYVTGAIYNAVKLDPQQARVSVSDADVPYATRHQFGEPSEHLPARPYFPMDDFGNPTEYTRWEMINAAVAEMRKQLA